MFLNFVLIVIFMIALYAFIKNGVNKIPAQPPTKAVLTLFGKRTNIILKEGYIFLPFYPIVFGMILVTAKNISLDIIIDQARTPDNATSKIPITLTYLPLYEVDEGIINFLNAGGEEGIEKQFSGKIKERVREWTMGQEEGPADWMELNKSQAEGVSILLKKLAGKSITDVPDHAQDVPTWIWLRYFLRPQPRIPFHNEIRWFEKDWALVKNELAKMSPNQIIDLKKAVETRRNEIDEIRSGDGKIKLPNLGIKILRLNIGEIDVQGKVAESAEKEAKEKQERNAEKLELLHVMERIKELTTGTQGNPGLGYSKEQALEIVQTERNKVPKSITEHKTSISSETLEAVKLYVDSIGKSIIEMMIQKGGLK